MKTIERNPDVDLDYHDVPPGMSLVVGKNLMHTARARKVPFGVATQKNGTSTHQRRETVGLIIRNGDLTRFQDALAVRGKYQPKTGRGA